MFEKCVSAGDKFITLGAKKIVTVWDGEVGVSYLKGKLVVLKPDRHTIDSTEHTFQGNNFLRIFWKLIFLIFFLFLYLCYYFNCLFFVYF